LPITTRWAIAVLVAQCIYILGLVLLWLWWATHGAPEPAPQAIWLEAPPPYRANFLGFAHVVSMAIAAPVAVASVVIAWKALNRAPQTAQAWPESMTYVSVITALLLIPVGLIGLFNIVVNLP
jgi:hypothetical protein